MRKPILMLAMLSAVLGGCVAYGDGYSRSGTNRDGYYGETYSYPRRDSDRDGIPDAYDRHPYGTNDGYYRRERDRDHDGIPDSGTRTGTATASATSTTATRTAPAATPTSATGTATGSATKTTATATAMACPIAATAIPTIPAGISRPRSPAGHCLCRSGCSRTRKMPIRLTTPWLFSTLWRIVISSR